MSRPTERNTDWRQQSRMTENHAQGRGWNFSSDDPPSLRPWFLAGVAVLLLVGMCFLASVSA